MKKLLIALAAIGLLAACSTTEETSVSTVTDSATVAPLAGDLSVAMITGVPQRLRRQSLGSMSRYAGSVPSSIATGTLFRGPVRHPSNAAGSRFNVTMDFRSVSAGGAVTIAHTWRNGNEVLSEDVSPARIVVVDKIASQLDARLAARLQRSGISHLLVRSTRSRGLHFAAITGREIRGFHQSGQSGKVRRLYLRRV